MCECVRGFSLDVLVKYCLQNDTESGKWKVLMLIKKLMLKYVIIVHSSFTDISIEHNSNLLIS